MKEGAIVAFVTIGLLILLVGIVASGLEDSGPISMARHFPLTVTDLNRAQTLGHNYRVCQLDFVHRNRAQYTTSSMLADSSEGVCAARLGSVTDFLGTKGYSGDVIVREVKAIKQTEDTETQKVIAVLYRGS